MRRASSTASNAAFSGTSLSLQALEDASMFVDQAPVAERKDQDGPTDEAAHVRPKGYPSVRAAELR